MEYNKEELKKKSIVAYMEASGYEHKHNSGKWTFFLSPFRQEGNPSFGVNTILNTWSDFGGESGGDIIELVMKLENLSFSDACEFIASDKSVKFVEFESKGDANKKYVEVTPVDIIIPSLDVYMTGVRKINKEVLYTYCSVVKFQFPASDYYLPCYGIGFKNDKGGWEVRNETYKIASTPKWYTTIGIDTESVNLFEGFINFLSALTYYGIKKFKNRTYVLNGTGQISAVLPILKDKHVNYFGDNDLAGNKVYTKLKQAKIKVTDCRDHYEFSNDLNDYITGK